MEQFMPKFGDGFNTISKEESKVDFILSNRPSAFSKVTPTKLRNFNDFHQILEASSLTLGRLNHNWTNDTKMKKLNLGEVSQKPHLGYDLSLLETAQLLQNSPETLSMALQESTKFLKNFD
mmetsp:Transcript_10161/g.8965  ORF Transcript_10161/g.8965 Transcript_10161/m.8965 type:complete len:121 (+) Transcript_10161:50-412(+)